MKLNRLVLPAVVAALATGCASNQTVQESAEYQSLQSQQQQLEQENQQLRAALSSSEQQPAPAPAPVAQERAKILGGLFDEGEEATLELPPGRNAWVQVVKGSLEVNGVELTEGDGLAVAEEDALEFKGIADSEILVFDLQ